MSEAILHFTDEAVEHIKKSLTRFPNGGFRLSIKKTGCSGYKYVPEILADPKANDVEFSAEHGFGFLSIQPALIWLKALGKINCERIGTKTADI